MRNPQGSRCVTCWRLCLETWFQQQTWLRLLCASQTGSAHAFLYDSEAKELDLDSAPADLGGASWHGPHTKGHHRARSCAEGHRRAKGLLPSSHEGLGGFGEVSPTSSAHPPWASRLSFSLSARCCCPEQLALLYDKVFSMFALHLLSPLYDAWQNPRLQTTVMP